MLSILLILLSLYSTTTTQCTYKNADYFNNVRVMLQAFPSGYSYHLMRLSICFSCMIWIGNTLLVAGQPSNYIDDTGCLPVSNIFSI